jgi:membrane-bound lytic murein transglycosylase D
MRQKGILLLGFIGLVSLIITFIFASGKFEKSKEFQERYAVFSLHIPAKVDFAGECVPLEYFDVKEALDRELHINTYWQSQTIFMIKRANRYFPEIEAILKDEGVPSDFKYLAMAESGLTNTLSPANAAGFWQFLKKTGLEFNLKIDSEVDERYNLEKSTHAACKFLKSAYSKYGNWTMAAASYNMGKSGLSKQDDFQKENNYYNLALNEETSRYIYRIIAFKLIIETPDFYGFHIAKNDLYPPLKYSTTEVEGNISDWALFANEHKTNYKILRLFNPWIRENVLTNKNKQKFIIRIPEEGFRESLYNEANSSDTTAQNNQ